MEKGGDSLMRMGRCTGGSCKMMGEGLLTNRLLPQLPGHAQPCFSNHASAGGRTREMFRKNPGAPPPQAVPAPENKERE